ncbi:MAG: methylase [Chryseobacterium sp.]|jgi:DNA modification methylase/superfamily II DNA or RNA helicase|nr:methylase [Chryseobacterium sp.]
MRYEEFLNSKSRKIIESGFDISSESLNPNMFDFQRYIVCNALKKGKFAIFADCGLGKTLMQLEFAHQVTIYTQKPVLILCPLAVSGQTIKEGEKFGIDVYKFDFECLPKNNKPDIFIINYEQLEKIDTSIFSGVVLDESSILKNFTGSYRNLIISNFENTEYKLACTATPSPNDELEIGNHAEFLNVMTSMDMRAVFFTTDKEIIKGNKYRLKNHAKNEFYAWINSWAVMISKPSDLGFTAKGYDLPELNFFEKQIQTEKKENGKLFNDFSISATQFNSELRITKVQRIDEVASIVNSSNENFIIWIKQNEEGELLRSLIPDAIEVKGSDTPEFKEKHLLGFARNEFRVLITKTKIAQFGLNYQNCRNQVFASLDFSFEGLYQAIRRSYRFGQKQSVNIFLITTDTMQNVIDNIKEKEQKFIDMQEGIIKNMNYLQDDSNEIKRERVVTDWFTLMNGDCVAETKKLEENSIDYSFFSPPFGALYVFSNDPKDMSNVANDEEFMQHFKYLIIELFRVLKPGCLCSLHIMQSTTLLGKDGFYSIKDFRGELIRAFQSEGFYFHAENMIRKDPKTAAIRTKNRQLMHGTTKVDSSIVRPGLADFIITFKKPGKREVPVQNNIPFDLWCKIAEPVWIDVEEGDTLEFRSAKDHKDERHLTPTQLTPIKWCYMMWVNKGETVFSPFSGIASEGVVAIENGMKYKGVELKNSYFDVSIKNLNNAVESKKQLTLF